MEDEKNERKAMEKKETVLISKGYSTVETLLKCDKKIELDLSDEKWEDLRCETGDEMECTYTIDQNNTITVKKMKLPKLYSGKVCVSSKESTVEVVPFSTCSSEKREKVVLWKVGRDQGMKEQPREGDTVDFDCNL
ncbi:hypothetical protein RFI_19507 [Reticulomyxa filosa]|uniref:Uncharacterized protein n=1 Tax=Reticulomyxa filosa TaxID=46433 RepID=X6MXK4_RETFI|nr:hypothetical protein RFI_19507 [Reticulomyxa filosa]|eukprot:ETO17805.1 hypothetical protein RFI_19507 [Reticulomyxa filosa]